MELSPDHKRRKPNIFLRLWAKRYPKLMSFYMFIHTGVPHDLKINWSKSCNLNKSHTNSIISLHVQNCSTSILKSLKLRLQMELIRQRQWEKISWNLRFQEVDFIIFYSCKFFKVPKPIFTVFVCLFVFMHKSTISLKGKWSKILNLGSFMEKVLKVFVFLFLFFFPRCGII